MKSLPQLAIIVVWAISVAAGLVGVDFGESHWDEPVTLSNAAYIAATGSPLPRHYSHPPLAPRVLAIVAPDVARLAAEPALDTPVFRRPILLRGRALFVVLTSTTILAAAVGAFSARRSWWEAAAAAAIVAGSFELSTHGRFLTPDGLLTAWTAWAVACALWGVERKGALRAAAVFAGLAFATKYTGGVLLLPLAVLSWRAHGIKEAAVVLLLAFAVLILAAPGWILEPDQVIGAIKYQQSIYSGGFHGFSLAPTQRFLAIVTLLSTTLLSPLCALSLLFFVCFLVSAGKGIRKRTTLFLILFFAMWTGLFASHSTHIARNYLPLVGPFAIVSSWVVGLSTVAWRRTAAAVVLMISGSAGVVTCLQRAVLSMAPSVVHLQNLREHLVHHQQAHFLISDSIRISLEQLGPLPENAHGTGVIDYDFIVALPDDLLPMSKWGGGDPFIAVEIFGPQEINWNLYPTWPGPARAVILTRFKASQLGVDPALKPPTLDLANQPTLPAELLKPPFR